MIKLVLVRHGESVWNAENRFTGWTDVDLSEKGIKEAIECGKILKENKFYFDIAFTSYLKRAIKTLWLILEQMDLMYIPEIKAWELNERHYGALQGLNKSEMAAKYGEEQVHIWRRSYDIRPPALEKKDPRSAHNDIKYKDLSDEQIPLTECLKDTVNRVVPYWESNIVPLLKQNKRIIIVAHGNSLRALIKHLDDISDKDIVNLNIPTGIPLVYEFDYELKAVNHYYLGDEKLIQQKLEQVKNQGKAQK
ncbi:MAG: 2,3-diphosphoglycerate-dependent phosphoglycerate mutase [Candidatus Anstonellales archaeon]